MVRIRRYSLVVRDWVGQKDYERNLEWTLVVNVHPGQVTETEIAAKIGGTGKVWHVYDGMFLFGIRVRFGNALC